MHLISVYFTLKSNLRKNNKFNFVLFITQVQREHCQFLGASATSCFLSSFSYIPYVLMPNRIFEEMLSSGPRFTELALPGLKVPSNSSRSVGVAPWLPGLSKQRIFGIVIASPHDFYNGGVKLYPYNMDFQILFVTV